MGKKMDTPLKRYNASRYCIFAFVMVTMLNAIMVILDDTHYLCSIFSSYMMFALYDVSFIFPVIGLIFLVPFVLSFIFSKKSVVWFIIGFVLMVLDTLFVGFILLVSLMAQEPTAIANCALEIIFHLVAIGALVFGLVNSKVAVESLKAQEAPGVVESENGEVVSLSSQRVEFEATVYCFRNENDKKNSSFGTGSVVIDGDITILGLRGIRSQLAFGNLASIKEVARFTKDDVREIKKQVDSFSYSVVVILNNCEKYQIALTKKNLENLMNHFSVRGYNVINTAE